jgi:hypothetical protein
MDVLFEVSKVVKLQGAMFHNGEFSSRWSLCSQISRAVAPHLASGAGHVVSIHPGPGSALQLVRCLSAG